MKHAIPMILAPLLSAVTLTQVEGIDLPMSLRLMRQPKWSNGGMVTLQFKDADEPVIWLAGPSGKRSVPFSIPGAQSITIHDFDRGSDGTIGVSGTMAERNGGGGFVARISPDGADLQIIRTDSYRPVMVAVAPDGSLWTAGSETVRPDAARGPAVIRRFDRSGKMTGSFVPQSSMGHIVAFVGSDSHHAFRVSKDRVAWYSTSGRYVEISLAGNVLTDIAVKLPVGNGKPEISEITFALTDEGQAFLCVPFYGGSTGQRIVATIYALDRSARVWEPAPVAEQHNGYIYGADAGRLVLMDGNRAVQFYRIGN
ncbi:MAG: hypothetical protein U0Q16_10005 [Bryobacteraceae bacterium]